MKVKLFTEEVQEPVPHLIYVIELEEPVPEPTPEPAPSREYTMPLVKSNAYDWIGDFCDELEYLAEKGEWPGW